MIAYAQGFKGISNPYLSVKAVSDSQVELENYFRERYLSGTTHEDTIKEILERGKLSKKSTDDLEVKKFAQLVASKIGRITYGHFTEFEDND